MRVVLDIDVSAPEGGAPADAGLDIGTGLLEQSALAGPKFQEFEWDDPDEDDDDDYDWDDEDDEDIDDDDGDDEDDEDDDYEDD